MTEGINFLCTTVTERTSPGQRQSIMERDAVVHVYVRAADSLAAVIITDQEYPVRVVFSLINKLLDDFSNVTPASTWKAAADDTRRTGRTQLVDFPQINDYLSRYQDPRQADTIMKVYVIAPASAALVC